MGQSWLNRLERRLTDPRPAFKCFKCGDSTERGGHIAPLRHTRNGPIDARTIAKLESMSIPDSDTWIELLDLCNGFHLYEGQVDPGSRELRVRNGVELFPLSAWESRTLETQSEWGEQVGDDAAKWELPYGKDDFLSIGHPSGSWNYIHLVTRGSSRGRVFWWDWTMPPASSDECLAESPEEFVSLLCDDPVWLLNEAFGCHSRYHDGQTDAQWIPLEFLDGRSN